MRITKLGDIANIITGPFGSQLHKEDYVEHGIPVIMPQNIADRRVDENNIAQISERDYQRLKRYATQKYDLVYARRGDVEKHAYIDHNKKALCGTGCLRIRVTDTSVVPLYLSFYLCRPETRKWLVTHAVGSNMPNLNAGILSEVPIELPDYATQVKVAKALQRIEDKVSLNEKVNDNLAQQAQLLFDFMFQDISGSKHIGDFIVPQRGTALLSKDAIPGDVPVVAGGLEPATYHNAANTVAPVITISSSGANAGFVNMWGVPVWSSDSSFIDFKMTPYVYFWYALLKRHQNNIYKIQTGSAQPHIYPSHIASLPVCDLNFEKVVDYTGQVTPLFSLIAKNYKEINQLRVLRDWLLPMLMNGQATISD